MNLQYALKAFIRKENILTTITIIIAIVIAVAGLLKSEIIDTGRQFPVILALLALIGINTIFERETRFVSLQKSLDDISKSISHESGIFINFKKVPSYDKLFIDNGATEVFIAGSQSFSIICSQMTFWEKWLKDGKKMKIIAQNPENKGLEHLILPMYGYEYKEYKQGMKGVLGKIKKLMAINLSCINVKLSDNSPAHGVTIVDGHLGGTAMIVTFYLPFCDVTSRPSVVLYKSKDAEIFDLFFNAYYKNLWDNSKIFSHSAR